MSLLNAGWILSVTKYKAKPSAPVEEFAIRFWEKVSVGLPEECWPWTGFCVPKGYGTVVIRQSVYIASRIAYFLSTGQWPLEQILHSCDNPPCCNPSHLREGSIADNMADRDSRGRHRNTQKTHCLRGHPLSGDNLKMHKGRRRCATCHRDQERERYQAKQLADRAHVQYPPSSNVLRLEH